jgi:hypothetical protein
MLRLLEKRCEIVVCWQRMGAWVSIGAGVIMACNWPPKLFKNLKLEFLI